MARGTGGKQAKAIGNQLRAAAADIVKATILEIDANLREVTPVDTGHARANWVSSIGSPHSGEDTGAAQAAGVVGVLAYKLEDGPAWETNNVPYIAALNDGHSAQAPALFVEYAVDKAFATMQMKFGSRAIPIEKFQSYVGAVGAANMASAYSPFGDD